MSKLLTKRDYLLAWFVCYAVVFITCLCVGILLTYFAGRFVLEFLFGMNVFEKYELIVNNIVVGIGCIMALILSFVTFVWAINRFIIRKVESQLRQKLTQEIVAELERNIIPSENK